MFSLRNLLVIVAISALGCAALTSRSPYWGNAIVTLTLGLATFGLVRIYTNPETRKFWIPALLIASMYCGFALMTPLPIREQLITSRLFFEWWYEERGHPLTQVADEPTMKEYAYFVAWNVADQDYIGAADAVIYSDFRSFSSAAHCLLGLMLGSIGGAVNQWAIHRKRARDKTSEQTS